MKNRLNLAVKSSPGRVTGQKKGRYLTLYVESLLISLRKPTMPDFHFAKRRFDVLHMWLFSDVSEAEAVKSK